MNNNDINIIVKFFFTLQLTNKLYHWTTESFARHKATDDFNTDILELTDKFVEVYIGIYNVKPNFSKIILFKELINDNDIVKIYSQFVTFLQNLDYLKNTDLLNIRDELLASLNKTLYLFRLK